MSSGPMEKAFRPEHRFMQRVGGAEAAEAAEAAEVGNYSQTGNAIAATAD